MKKTTLGSLLIVVPFILLVLTLILFAISSFVLSGIEGAQIAPVSEISDTDIQDIQQSPATSVTTAAQIIRIISSLLGMVAVGGIFIGIPLGVYFLVKGEDEKNYPEPPQPPPIQK